MSFFNDFDDISENLKGINQKLGETIEIGENLQNYAEEFSSVKEEFQDKLSKTIEIGENLQNYAEEFSNIKEDIEDAVPLYDKMKDKLSKIQKNSGKIFMLILAILVTLMILMFSFNNVMISVFKNTQQRLVYFGIIALIFVFMIYKLYQMFK
jgi:predicted nucleic acid-binding Zn ribbon protein